MAAKQIGPTDLAKYNKLNFEFTYSRRNEEVSMYNVGGDIVIEKNGLIYQMKEGNSTSANVVIIGGNGNFVNQLSARYSTKYMSAQQKATLSHILQQVAMKNFDAEITSSDVDLHNIVNTTYFNFMG